MNRTRPGRRVQAMHSSETRNFLTLPRFLVETSTSVFADGLPVAMSSIFLAQVITVLYLKRWGLRQPCAVSGKECLN